MTDVRGIDLTDDAVASRVVALQRAAYRIEADLIGFDGIPPLHEDVAAVRALELSWLGCWDDDRLIGLIAWSEADGVRDIDRVAVDPDQTGRGYGRSLVAALMDHRTVTVSTGTANAPARSLYESMGFRVIGTDEIAPGVTVTRYCRAT